MRFLILLFIASLIYGDNLQKSDFTEIELDYLQKTKKVTYAGDPNWLPFEAFKDGEYIGIIGKKLNIEFDKIITKDWLETLELSKEKKVDIISAVIGDEVLNKNYKPIDSYFNNPLVIVMKNKNKFIYDLNHLQDKKISYLAGAGYSNDILEKYPNIKFLEAKSPQDGLLGIKTGKYDVFIGSLAMVDYLTVKMGLADIKVVGKTDINMKITLFIHKDKPQLYSIINKTMKKICEEAQHNIVSKWRNNGVRSSAIDYTLIWQIIGIFGVIIIVGLSLLLISRRDNKELNQLINTTIEGIAIFENGKLIEANNPLLEMLGYDFFHEIKGKTVYDFIEERQHKYLKEHLKKSQEPYEFMMLKKDGTIFPVLARGTNINHTRRVSSIIDLTNLKNTEKELEILNQSLQDRVNEEVDKNRAKDKQMIEQSRLAQMGKMISMIAHQWRQPLTAISGSVMAIDIKLQSGKFDFKIENERNEFLKIMDKKHKNIHEYIQNLSTTIDEFRSFFKPDKKKELVSLTTPIKKALKIAENSMKSKRIEIQTHFDTDKTVLIYQNELIQVILNILKNAEDNFLEKNITDSKINIDTMQEGNNSIITVCDNGGGIAKEIIENIFDPYFSTKSEKNGTGLGLYMSKVIVQEHCDGELKVENSDSGVCFKIVLGECKSV